MDSRPWKKMVAWRQLASSNFSQETKVLMDDTWAVISFVSMKSNCNLRRMKSLQSSSCRRWFDSNYPLRRRWPAKPRKRRPWWWPSTECRLNKAFLFRLWLTETFEWQWLGAPTKLQQSKDGWREQFGGVRRPEIQDNQLNESPKNTISFSVTTQVKRHLTDVTRISLDLNESMCTSCQIATRPELPQAFTAETWRLATMRLTWRAVAWFLSVILPFSFSLPFALSSPPPARPPAQDRRLCSAAYNDPQTTHCLLRWNSFQPTTSSCSSSCYSSAFFLHFPGFYLEIFFFFFAFKNSDRHLCLCFFLRSLKMADIFSGILPPRSKIKRNPNIFFLFSAFLVQLEQQPTPAVDLRPVEIFEFVKEISARQGFLPCSTRLWLLQLISTAVGEPLCKFRPLLALATETKSEEWKDPAAARHQITSEHSLPIVSSVTTFVPLLLNIMNISWGFEFSFSFPTTPSPHLLPKCWPWQVARKNIVKNKNKRPWLTHSASCCTSLPPPPLDGSRLRLPAHPTERVKWALAFNWSRFTEHPTSRKRSRRLQMFN